MKAFQALAQWTRDHQRRALEIREALRISEETLHLILAAGVGVAAAMINLVFFKAVRGIEEPLAAAAVTAQGNFGSGWEWWQCLLIPSLGGLAAGLILHWGLRLAGPRTSPNILEVVVVGDGRLPFRASLIRAISSLLSISTGASVGREGPLTNLTAGVASRLGQLAHWAPYRLRMLVACGAAAGIAAAYNAPIAGAVFSAQIVLGNFSMNLFAPLVVASVAAAVTSRSFFGIDPWYRVPEGVDFTRLSQLPWFIVLGIVTGMVGAAFLKSLNGFEKLWQLKPIPLPARLMGAGLFVGAIGIVVIEVMGNGYGATNRILSDADAVPVGMLVVWVIAKWLATGVCVGAGTVGGVFTPTLFIGAGIGTLFWHGLHFCGWANDLPKAAFALTGMGGTLAATTHSPLLAMILLFEISLNYTLMPPLMVACAIATLTARRFHPQTIYTEALARTGLAASHESDQIGAANQQTVGDLLREPIPPLREDTAFEQIANRFLTHPNNFLPVVDFESHLMGVVALQDLKEYLKAGDELKGIIAADIMRPPPPVLTPDQRLSEALPILLASELRHVPVVNSKSEMRLIGCLHRAEALGLLSEAIVTRTRS